MPELPEVETIVRGLQGALVGRTFTGVEIGWRNSIGTSPRELTQDLPGQRITALSRRGKYLQFTLSGNRTLLLHLKMSGDLLVESSRTPRSPHVRTVFSLDNDHELRFKDPRKFGRVYFVRDPSEIIGHLGPEPLAEDFSFERFHGLFRNRKGCLKALLLKQEFLAGIGNIYADESCFHARISPLRSAQTLSGEELLRLYHAIRKVLNRGIMLKGSSFDAVYRGGEFQKHFSVYGRTGAPCRACKT
ncbi:MAG: Formamidopyrimidine-DNA glycosylase, partial [Pseudomonadota bacterium]